MSRGHVRQRGSVWYVVVDAARDPLNPKQRKQKWLRTDAATKRQAEIARTRILREQDTGQSLDVSKVTVEQHVRAWFESSLQHWRHGTRRTYEIALRIDIIPHLGALPVASLTPVHIREWLKRIRARGIKETSVHVKFMVLHAALTNAVDLELLVRNPADRVVRPSTERVERAIWDGAQSRCFIEFIKGDRHEGIYLTIIGTGLRQGEALALRWRDVDLDDRLLTVAQGQVYVKGVGATMAKPKTSLSSRKITLPVFVVAALREQRARQHVERERVGADLWEESGLVFTKPTGEALPISTLKNSWGRLRQRFVAAGIPYCAFHDLRHLHAVIGLEAGIDAKTISERLGHHRPSFTMDVYGHVTPKMRDRAADVYDGALAGEDD